MSNDINRVTLTGHLTREAELRSTPNGTPVCSFSIAVNRRKKGSDGNWTDEVSYFDITYWGKAGEATKPYLTKGRQVVIDGELRQRTWEKDGRTISKVEVVAKDVQLIGGANTTKGSVMQKTGTSGEAPAPIEAGKNIAQAITEEFNAENDYSDMDIPF